MTWLWVVAALVIVVLIIKSLGSNSNAKSLNGPDFSNVSPEQAASLVGDIRDLAFAGYERGSSKALEDGQSPRFAHEVGILDAGFSVLANQNEMRANENVRQNLQMELVPFNTLNPQLGRAAVAEFLVWKFFPERADKQVLQDAFDEFIEQFISGGNAGAPTDAEIQGLIYSGRYDWQPLAQEAMARRA